MEVVYIVKLGFGFSGFRVFAVLVGWGIVVAEEVVVAELEQIV